MRAAGGDTRVPLAPAAVCDMLVCVLSQKHRARPALTGQADGAILLSVEGQTEKLEGIMWRWVGLVGGGCGGRAGGRGQGVGCRGASPF